MDQRAKLTFWGTASAAFLLVCIPTSYFVEALRRYERYLTGVSPTTLRATRTQLVPHRVASQKLEPKSKLDFVEFRIKQPKAKQVQLIGDFNGWKQNGLPLSRQSNGQWELLLPLPAGRHHYLFVIDGQTLLDPANAQTADVGGRRASVKVIQ